MGIVTLQPDSNNNTVNVNTLPEAITEPNKSTFTTLVPETRYFDLLKYVEGYRWTVDYYGQILNENNTLNHFDPTIPNFAQSYYKVNKLILQVSSVLTSNYDNSTGITTITGSSITPYKIKPNVGDVFIANIDTNEDAIFIVTNVTRKTYRKDTLYEIEYNLYAYTSVQPSFLENLNSRVQDTYYFNQDTNYFNRDVLIKPSVKEAIDRLRSFLVTSTDYYFSTFYQPITGSLFIPGTDENTFFDLYLEEFLMSTCDFNSIYFKKISLFNFSNISMYKNRTLYDVIQKRDKSFLNSSFFKKQCVFISSIQLNNKVRLGSPFFTNIDYIIAPKNLNTSLNIDNLDRYPSQDASTKDCRTDNNYNNYFNKTIPTITGNKLLLHPLFNNDYYLVTNNFYTYLNGDTTVNLSFLEFLIFKFINKEAINYEDLVIAIQDYYNWSLLHQFYLLPVFWHIVKNIV